ncbi:MAG: fatty acid--CoA ligase family protein [Chlamydiales bacterium]|nr:fatty acid--CoA ligase family protein [Chlamydiales bacterium]
MTLQWLFQRMSENASRDAIIAKGHTADYAALLTAIEHQKNRILSAGITSGSVVFLQGNFSLQTVAFFLALLDLGAIAVPYSQSHQEQKKRFQDISEAEYLIEESGEITSFQRRASHALYQQLRTTGHPGLVLFSSGTTGPSKGIVHDATSLLEKFKHSTPRFQRVLAFLILDHLGGIDTLLYTLANCGCLVVPDERSPDDVLSLIDRYKVEVFPTSPSFLNLMLLSGAFQRHDLSSLRKISYGSEPMPSSLLERLHRLFPFVKLTQTYGISEVGVLRSVSKASDSLLMQIGGKGFETRVVDGVLQIKSPHMMLGYLNALSMMTADGWFVTGDLVEESESFIQIKGRANEVINVGGQKVNPLEVEEVIREVKGVDDALVYGEANSILGQIVCVNVVGKKNLEGDIRSHCLARLPKYKVPVKIQFVDQLPMHERSKRQR